MCGRAYETYTLEELEMRYENERFRRKPLGIRANYNLAPTQLSPVVVVREGERRIELFRWGLVPSWAKTVKDADKYSLINAKGEEIDRKRSYQAAFSRRRCIVPLSGFYEWLRPEGGGPKRPFAIHLKNEPIMSVAGVWEHWESPSSEEKIDSFSIITTSANSFMSRIHDRMFVILAKEDEEAWLDPEDQDKDRLKKFLKPSPPEWLEAHEVSTRVNSPRNNVPECIEPIQK